MKNNKKMTRKTKDEKRRLAFEKRNVKKEQNLARYGAEGGSALVIAKTTNLNRRLIALLLTFALLISCLIVGISFIGRADDSQASMKPAGNAGVPDQESGMVVNKYLEPNNEGKYDLKLEAYSTKEMEPITEKIPTDFVVVVDQSGSMDTVDMPIGTPQVKNDVLLETIANSDKGYYYYDEATGSYYRTYGVKDYLYRYYPANYWYVGDIVERLGQRLRWFMSNRESTSTFSNQLYYRETVGDKVYYQPVTMTIRGAIGTYDVRFKYYSQIEKEEKWFNRNDETYMNGHQAPWYKNLAGGGLIDDNWGINIFGRQIGYPQVDDIVQGMYIHDEEYCHSTFTIIPGLWKLETGMYVNYPIYDRHVGYTKLCYRDINGVEHEVPSNQNGGQTTWEYCDDNGNARSQQSASSTRPTYSNLYTYENYEDRLTTLKAALNQFAGAVANEKDSFGAVDNRISIIGFSSMSSSSTHDPDSHTNRSYNNTELLTHTERDVSGTNGWQKDTCDSNIPEYYGKGLVASTNGNIGAVNGKITNAINALTANGGTQPEDGLNMAYQVLTNRGVGEGKTTYTIRSGEKKGRSVDRNTVVIFFTDGQPGNYHESNQYEEANEVVEQAKDIKDYGAKLFSIGVFGESDGNPLTYDGRNDWTQDNQGNTVRVRSLDSGYWEYLGGWVETYDGTYCLRRQWRPGDSDYTETANDTIFDYMSVTSSNYSNAETFIDSAWLSGTFSGTSPDIGDYVEATEGVRGTGLELNQFYRMASNQDTLVAAFMQAVTMNNEEAISPPVDLTGNAVLKDILSDSFLIDIPEGQSKPVITCETVKCSMDVNKNVTEDSGEDAWDDITDQLGDSNIGYDEDTKTISIKGFSYTDNYVANPKPADREHGLEANQGKKLVVTIKNVFPTPEATSKDAVIYSNDGSSSGLFVPNEDDAQTLKKQIDLPRPSISRHSYKLEVTGDAKSTATFKVAPSLVNGNDISNVILAYPNEEGGLTRIKYTDYLNASDKYFDMKDGQAFYFENVPADYGIETSIIANDAANTYTWTDLDPEVVLSMDNPTSNSANPNTYSDEVLHITSVANVRTVTIKEAVDDSAFANQGDKFVPTVYIEAPTGVNVDDTATFGETEWRKYGENRMVLNKDLDPIQADGQESITLTLPSGWKLIVDQTDDNDYSVKSATYKVDSTEATSDYAEGGWNWTITKDATITITNTRPSIPVEGINNSSNHNWIIYILVGIAAIAVIGAGIFLWKKKDEFVEE